jgi:integrase
MASVSFVLKDPNSTEPTLIYFIVRHGNKRLKYSTGEKVIPEHWDAKNYKARGRTGDAKDINNQLPRYKEVYRKYLAYLDGAGEPFDLNHLKDLLEERFKAAPAQRVPYLVDFAENYKATANKKHTTLKAYGAAISKLKAYERAKKTKLRFEDIDLEFYYSYRDFLINQGLALNSIGGAIKNLKVFMEVSFDSDLHKNQTFKNKRFKVEQEDTTQIYLTESELDALLSLDLSNNTRLEVVRDYFILGCRTGLRFSDLQSMVKENIIETESGPMFKIRTRKTGETVFIPMHAQSLAILDKYNFTLPRLISNQKFNSYIKEVAKVAGIDTDTTTHRTEGGQSVEKVSPKFELVSVHTARRTFATLAYKAGLPASSIMKITGHKTERTFQKYIKLTNQEHAELLAKTAFFSPLRKVN